MSYQSAVPGLIGIPVSVTPTTEATYLFLSVFIGFLEKQNLILCFLNLCGLPRVGKFPISWFGVPSDEIQDCSLAYAYSLLEMNKENKKIINRKGNYIEPSEFRSVLENNLDDVYILDVRSNYEHEIGKFKNAITLNIDNFREFPNAIDEIEDKIHQNKKIITYCTGGVKCEKASAFLNERGYKNVYQLHGGIIKYGIEENGKDFEGKCYVFDNRIVKDINKVNPKIIGKCYVTAKKADRMVNCANADCNKHFPLSDDGAKIYNGCCSNKCMKSCPSHERFTILVNIFLS